MKKILLINGYRTLLLEIPLFGKMKVTKIPESKLKGRKFNAVIIDEAVKKKDLK